MLNVPTNLTREVYPHDKCHYTIGLPHENVIILFIYI